MAQTEGFWVHPTSFELAVDVALNSEFNFKAARFGTYGYNPNSTNSFSLSNRPHSTDLCLAETNEEAELRTVENNIAIFDDVSYKEPKIICTLIVLYVRHVRLLRSYLRHEPEFWYGAVKRILSVGAGSPAREALCFVEPLGGISEQNLGSKSSMHFNTGRKYEPGLLFAKDW